MVQLVAIRCHKSRTVVPLDRAPLFMPPSALMFKLHGSFHLKVQQAAKYGFFTPSNNGGSVSNGSHRLVCSQIEFRSSCCKWRSMYWSKRPTSRLVSCSSDASASTYQRTPPAWNRPQGTQRSNLTRCPEADSILGHKATIQAPNSKQEQQYSEMQWVADLPAE